MRRKNARQKERVEGDLKCMVLAERERERRKRVEEECTFLSFFLL
jgi:hypothetical protein